MLHHICICDFKYIHGINLLKIILDIASCLNVKNIHCLLLQENSDGILLSEGLSRNATECLELPTNLPSLPTRKRRPRKHQVSFK
jgi:hypothetical protein